MTAAMTLASVQTGASPMPARVLSYGVDGIGKSTFWSQAPSPIFILTEDGASRLAVAKFPLCQTWESVLECLRVLCREKHDYKTLVLDSADWAQELMVNYILRRDYGWKAADPASQAEAQRKFSDFGKGWRPAFSEWLGLLSALDYVRKAKGMEIALIAHSVVSTFKNPEGDDYNIYKSNLHDAEKTSLWARTKEWADMVFFFNYRVTVKDTQDVGKAKKGKGIMAKGDNSRMCYTSKTAAWDAKVRAGWNMPAAFPLSYATYRAYLDGNVEQAEAEEPQAEGAE